MSKKMGERRKKQLAIIDVYKISQLEDNPSFRRCYRDVTLNKSFPNLLMAYNVLKSDWYIFKNDAMGTEFFGLSLSDRKIYSLDALLSSVNVPMNVKAVIVHAFQEFLDE